MPSAKTNRDEIYALRKKRNAFAPGQNIYTNLFFHCSSAVEGGFITQDRAASLKRVVESEDVASKIFPNTILLRALNTASVPGGWSPDMEALLLRMITELYLGEHVCDRVGVGVVIGIDAMGTPTMRSRSIEDDRESLMPPGDIYQFLADISTSDSPLLSDAYELIFDSADGEINLENRFVGFTGKFDGFTRKSCFELARKYGGVPSDPNFYLDYLFVSDTHRTNSVVSTQLMSAIFFRRTYGNPRIFRESEWKKANGIA